MIWGKRKSSLGQKEVLAAKAYHPKVEITTRGKSTNDPYQTKKYVIHGKGYIGN